ncbi:hypothetical protein S40293_03749 [Stachybotrys chartarum IBT 40293]|nr:hypothetical protein S40293_03749 [Stachybotrys chartarum IBT 40293]
MMATKRPVRIMNISGSPVDNRSILAKAAASSEPVDVFTGDWMSELNMPSRAVDYTQGLDVGYEPTFLEALEPALETLAEKRIKLAANAGVVATKDLFEKVVEMVNQKGLDLTVAWVEGDAVMDIFQTLRKSGTKFKHISAGIDLDSWAYKPVFAQCYLGGWAIAKALQAGADIVVCGRVADASPTIGAAAWWHSWARTDYDKLAQALMAGHLIECSTYVTGGNFTGFKGLDWSRIHELGYPIAEIAADGDVVITKNQGTGGVVNLQTCKEQLLYEIQGKYYLNCDVTAVIDRACLEEIAPNRVRLSGITGLPPPKTTKAGLTAPGGYTAEIHWALVGLDIEEKVKMTDIQLRRSFGPERLARFTCFSLQHYGSVPENPRNQNEATVDLRLVVQARDEDALSTVNFARPALDFIMASFPAATFHPDKRSTKPMAFQEYFPTLIPQPTVTVHFSKSTMEAVIVGPPQDATDALANESSSHQTDDPVALDSFGVTIRAPFGHVVLGRAGDKGSNCNVGFFMREESEWPWLKSMLSTERCDGKNPCSNCDSFAVRCQYPPARVRAQIHGQQRSFQAMQKRLAELEMMLGKQDEAGSFQRNRQTSLSSTATDESMKHGASTCSDYANSSARQTPGASTVSGTDEKKSTSTNPLLILLREMSIGALGEYMGATSQITMSRIINSMSQSRDEIKNDMDDDDGTIRPSESNPWEHLSPKSANSNSKTHKTSVDFAQIPDTVAKRLFRGYLVHISTRWPVMHTPYIRQLHETRASLSDKYEITALHLVYAIGGRFLETTGERGEFHSDRHCEEAIQNLDEIIRNHAGLRSIQILILLSLYNLRSPRGPGAWTFAGLAMRQCIEMGLHRQTRMKWSLIEEMRRRVFWTCYCLDRQVSIILGRPFSISDRDIDTELPTDVDESIEDEDSLRVLQQEGRNRPWKISRISTSMTGFIYMCRLRVIESDIQQTIYRVDKVPPDMRADVESFITRLEQWKAEMPSDARQLPDFRTMRVDGYQNYMAYYYKCMRFLLYPVVLSSEIADVYFLKRCAEACAGVCRTYKKLHQSVPVGFSVMALHSIFIAGLTLLYCIWAAPAEVFNIATSNGLNACSIVMYVIADRWVGARKYRDVFDVIKQAVMESVETGADEPRRVITDLRLQVLTALRSAGSNERDCRGEFSAMVNGMAADRDDRGEAIVSREDQRPEWQTLATDAPSVAEQRLDNMLPMEGMPLLDDMVFSFPSVEEMDMMARDPLDAQQNEWGFGNCGP